MLDLDNINTITCPTCKDIKHIDFGCRDIEKTKYEYLFKCRKCDLVLKLTIYTKEYKPDEE